MKRILTVIISGIVVSVLATSCSKKPLTLGEETSMKTLLKASDKEIKELAIKEAKEKANLSEENVDVEYILRDEKNQTLVVKMKIKKGE